MKDCKQQELLERTNDVVMLKIESELTPGIFESIVSDSVSNRREQNTCKSEILKQRILSAGLTDQEAEELLTLFDGRM